jgi:hypothetical protein
MQRRKKKCFGDGLAELDGNVLDFWRASLKYRRFAGILKGCGVFGLID